MIGRDCDECSEWEKQPQAREIVTIKGEPRDRKRDDDEQKAQVSERAVGLIELGHRGFAGLLALSVFLRWRCLSG